MRLPDMSDFVKEGFNISREGGSMPGGAGGFCGVQGEGGYGKAVTIAAVPRTNTNLFMLQYCMKYIIRIHIHSKILMLRSFE